MDKGFYKSFGIASKVEYDAVDLMDLILSRYNDMYYIDKLEIDWAISLFDKAISKRRDEELWDVYLAKFPNMTEKNYISFNDYKKKMYGTEMEEELDIVETVDQTFNRFKSKVKK